MAEILDDDAVNDALAALPGWEREGDVTIVRYAKLPDFVTAIAAVDEVARVAEQDQHHPDIDIRYNSVKFKLSTHSEGALTTKDTEMAAKISSVVDAKQG